MTDFGLAKLLREGSAGPTQTGELLGTPCYMAPEQVEGSRAGIGPATDVYGLGAILYELLTGRPPFRGETPLATCRQILSTEPVAPSRLQPACPRDVETICLKCLQKEPAKRYASAEALADDLRRFIEGRPIAARPVSVWGRAVKWARRRPTVAALLAGIVGVTLLGLAGISRKWLEADRERRFAEGERQLALTRSYFDRIGRAYQEEALAHQVTHADQLLEECRRQTPELCRWEWHFLKRRCNEHLLELQGHTRDVQCVAYSPDGLRLASCSGEVNGDLPGEVWVWDAVTGRQLHDLAGHRATVYSMAFHPDGRRLASAGRDKVVRLWDLKEPQPRPVELEQPAAIFCVAFHPDGKRLAVGCADGWVRVTDLTTGLSRGWHLHRGPYSGNVFSVAYSRDGRQLASVGRDGWVCLFDAETGAVRRRFQHAGDARRVAFSPDGRWLVSAAYEGTLKWLDLTKPGAEPLQYHLHGGEFLSLAFSPDGRQLACSTWGRGVVLLSTDTGHVQFTLREDPGVRSLAFHPDGRYLATTGNNLRVKVWDLTGPKEPRTFAQNQASVYSLAIHPDRPQVALAGAFNRGRRRLARTLRVVDLDKETLVREFGTGEDGHGDSLTSVAYRPDGRQLATGSADGTARLWDAATGAQEQTWKHKGAVTAVAYSPDGTALVTACLDGRLRLWDVAGGRLQHTFAGHAGGVANVAFAPGGRRLLSGGMDHTVRVWDVATGGVVGEYGDRHTRTVSSLALSRDGTRLASAGLDQVLWLWHVAADGTLTPAHGPIPLGQPAAEEKQPAAEEKLAVLRGSRRACTSLAFSPDGHRLASVSPDRPVRLWDVTTGLEVLTLADTPDDSLCVAFTPDGRRLVVGDADGRVIVWDTEFLGPTARAQAAAERALSWHWDRAVSADNDRAHFAEVFHTSRGIAARPQEYKWYHYRGWAHAQLGQWHEAQADYARAVELKPQLSRLWRQHAATYLGAGDHAGHHDACARMLDQVAKDPDATPDCLYACAPDPEAGGNPDRLVALGQAAVNRALVALGQAMVKGQAEPARRAYGAALRRHGAALYRARRFAEAAQTFEEAGKNLPPRAWDWLFRAMAHQHTGEPTKAQEEFAEAVKLIEKAGRAAERGSGWMHWMEQVEVEALRREAEALLRGER